MIQMLHPVAIAVPARRDVKVALHLIPLQTTINPTRINLLPPPELRSLRELLTRIAPQLTKHMARTRVLFLRRYAPLVLLIERLVFPTTAKGLVVALIHPQLPACWFALQHLGRKDAVTRCILDVDMQVVAGHADDGVEV